MKPPNPLSALRCCDPVSSVLGRRAVAAALQSTQQPVAAQWRRSSVAHLAATQQPVARCAFPVHARSQCLCTLSHTERGHTCPLSTLDWFASVPKHLPSVDTSVLCMSTLKCPASVLLSKPSVDTCISRCTCTRVHARPIRLCTQPHAERGRLTCGLAIARQGCGRAPPPAAAASSASARGAEASSSSGRGAATSGSVRVTPCPRSTHLPLYPT